MSIARNEGQPDMAATQQRVHVQRATAAESAVVIQVGRDLYLSDAGLFPLWTPGATSPDECPYPGLDAFGPGQAKWFFGRETVTGELLRHVDEMTLAGSGGGAVLVVGPSGAGKSSVLAAGLLTALSEGRLPAPGSATWPQVIINPGPHPLGTLREALGTLARAQTAVGARPVIVVDQLEEIFTLCEDDAERPAFVSELGQLADPPAGQAAVLVLGMRADFYAQATAFPFLRGTMQSRQVVLGAMSPAEIRQAITLPARAAGLTLQSGLTERLLHDLGMDETADGAAYEPGRLPLLAHALRATWLRRDGKQLTIAGYEATGGIVGAIAITAESVYDRLDKAGQAAARQIFLGLVRVGESAGEAGDGEGTADTRRRVSADSLLTRSADPAAAREALEAFTATRLLTSGGQAVQITHEALLRRWPRLRGWIDEDRSGHLVRQNIEDAAESWQLGGRDASGLYGGVRLAQARAWADDGGRVRELTSVARDFLAASDRRRRRGTRRRNAIIALLAALTLAMAGLSGFALNQRAAAQANYTQAEASVLAAESGVAWGNVQPDTADEFAVAAERLDPTASSTINALLGTQVLPIVGRLRADDAFGVPNVASVAYNPAGTVIAGGTQDGYIRLWSASTYHQLWAHQIKHPGGVNQVNSIAFSPDGRTLAVAQPGAVWLWDVSNPAHPVALGSLSEHSPNPKSPFVTFHVAFSQDGSTLAAAIAPSVSAPLSEVMFWNMSTHSVKGLIQVPGTVNSLAFTPNGQNLVTAASGGTVDLWNVAHGTLTSVLQAANTTNGATGTVAVSPNGQLVAFGAGNSSSTNAVKVWSFATHKVTATLLTHIEDGVSAVAFSPNGDQLAAGSLDGSVRLWDIHFGAVLLSTLTAHVYPILAVAFSPNGKTLADASEDASIALWSTEGNTLGGQANLGLDTTFSPDGRTLAVATVAPKAGYVVALYSMPARKLTAVLPTGTLATTLAFSPDGKTLAVALNDSATGTVQLWNVASHRMTGQIATHQVTIIRGMAFSPDGTLLATSGEKDPTVKLWSIPRLSLVGTLNARLDTDFPPALGGGTLALAFSPDGRLLALAGIDGMIRLFSVPGLSLVSHFQVGETGTALTFSPNGRELAIGDSDGAVYVESVPVLTSSSGPPSTALRGILDASTRAIQGVQFESDSRLIAAGLDGNVRIWNVPGSDVTVTIPAATILTHTGAITWMSYSNSLGLVATLASSGTRIWQTNPAQVATELCQELRTPVPPLAWHQYMSEYPYQPVCG